MTAAKFIVHYLSIFAAACALLGGCMTYQYNGKSYSSEGDALAAQQQRYALALVDIKPTSHPVGGSLRMYFVDRDTAAKVLTELAGDMRGATADYLLNSTYEKVRFTRDAIEKRRIFDRVELEYSSGTHRNSEADACVLYYYAPASSNQSWYFISKQVPRTRVRFDDTESDLRERTLYFLDLLEYLARGDCVTP